MVKDVISASSAADLIAAVRDGSDAALKRLYDQQSPRLFGIALRIVGRRDIAGEVLQDSFVQVWENASRYVAERGDAVAWLTGIVRYRALDAVRKMGREILTDDPRLGDGALEPDIVEQIDFKRAGAPLRRCLDLLDEGQRRSIILAFVDGLSQSQIAARLGAPLGTVKSWVRRALISLRSCLES
jgi:RNA polymerase sigma-70 factor (ECF subfamily)